MVTRRQLLARAGLAAAGWPLAGAIAGRGHMAHAAGAPLRLLVFPLLNGAEHGAFWPNPGNLAAMSRVTSPLAAFQKQITFVRGVEISGSMNHMAVRSMFTGAPIADYLTPDPTVKSVDQVAADALGAGTTLRSLHLGVIPADSIELYQLYGRSTFFFAPRPVDYEANPVKAFDRTFKGAAGPPAPTMPPPGTPPGTLPPQPTNFTNDVLDLNDAEFGELGEKLRESPIERRKLDQHREALKGLRVTNPPNPTPGGGGPGVMPPPQPTPAPGKCDASPLASVEKLRPALQGKDREAYKHQYYSDIFDAQIDIAARALVCGLTRVATIQAGSADGNVTDPVGPGYPHHNTSHGDQNAFSMCQTWYMTKLQRLVQALNVPDPLDASGKTVLYNSVVLVLSECMPVGHESTSVPAMLIGNAGGALKAGTYLDLKSVSNKALLQTVLQVLGAGSAPHFGGTTISELRA